MDCYPRINMWLDYGHESGCCSVRNNLNIPNSWIGAWFVWLHRIPLPYLLLGTPLWPKILWTAYIVLEKFCFLWKNFHSRYSLWFYKLSNFNIPHLTQQIISCAQPLEHCTHNKLIIYACISNFYTTVLWYYLEQSQDCASRCLDLKKEMIALVSEKHTYRSSRSLFFGIHSKSLVIKNCVSPLNFPPFSQLYE